jgi:hypothetical protein
VWTTIAAAGVVLLAGCSAAPKTTAGELFTEYTRNTHVRNDVFPGMGTSADRLANLASMGGPQQIEASILGAYPCAEQDTCKPDDQVLAAMRTVIGPGAKTTTKTGVDRLYQRLILVKHGSGQMELLHTYVAKKPDGTPVLIDGTGRTYHDLADYQGNNDLSSDDLILTLREITAVPGRGKIVAVPGHTTTNPWPWVGGAVVVLAAAAAGVVVWRRRTLAREFPEPQPSPANAYPNRPEM